MGQILNFRPAEREWFTANRSNTCAHHAGCSAAVTASSSLAVTVQWKSLLKPGPRSWRGHGPGWAEWGGSATYARLDAVAKFTFFMAGSTE
jgi:hypothetical protein